MANRKVADGIHVRLEGGGTRLLTPACHRGEHQECRARVREDRLLEVVTLPCECQCHALLQGPREYDGGGGLIRLVVDAPAQLLTMNAAKSMHHRPWSELTKAWRDATAQRAWKLKIPPVIGVVGIDARPHQYGGNMADAGAHMPCVKACVDGLRDANVLEDDSSEFVSYVRCWAPVNSTVGAGMVLELVPPF